MATLPFGRTRADAGTGFSPLIAIGFALAFISPSLLNAWNMPPALVIGAMLLPPIAGLLLTAVRWPPRGFNVAGSVLSMLLLLIVLLMFELTLTNAKGTENVRMIAANGLTFFLVSLTEIVGLVVVASSNKMLPPVSVIIQSLYVGSVGVSVVQILLLIVGVTNPLGETLAQQGDEALILKALGIQASRTVMPFSGGFQAGAIAPLVASLIAMTKIGQGNSGRHVAALLFGLLPMLILDARQFVLSLVFVALIQGIVRRNVVVALIGVVIPWLCPLLVMLAQWFPSIASAVSSRSDRFGMFSGRQFIWNEFATYWSYATFEQQLIGNGIYGQAVGGISLRYAFMFSGWSETAKPFMTLHNSYIQALADGGVVGFVIWMMLIGFTIYRGQVLSKSAEFVARPAWRAVAAIALALAFIGSTEPILSLYFKEAVPVWLTVFLVAALYGGRSKIQESIFASNEPERLDGAAIPGILLSTDGSEEHRYHGQRNHLETNANNELARPSHTPALFRAD